MFDKFDIVVIGAGLYGSVIAEQASRDGFKVAVIESRDHIGGNCYTETDAETGINVHKYGAHIFHTNSKDIWDYINRFTEFNNYKHKVKTRVGNKSFSMPINLDTINSFFNAGMVPIEAEKFIKSLQTNTAEPQNFEEQALALIGQDMYDAFIRGYTVKQWERDPKELPASIIKRLPVRTNYDDNYFFDRWQGIPVDGYTPIFEKMLSHENIEVFLNTSWDAVKLQCQDKLVIYTGAIDRFYDYCYGDLNWRTLDFVTDTHDVNDFQGCVAMNYADEHVPYTRQIEHKHFHPEKSSGAKTIVTTEYSRTATREDTPYYPVNTDEDRAKYELYREKAEQETNVLFGGRLGEYRYYDMHQVIGSALAAYKNKIKSRLSNN